MVEFVEYIAKAIVQYPDEVRVEEKEIPMGKQLLLYVNQEDMGRVIGRGGKIANAMRTVLKAVSMKENCDIYLEIVANE